MVPFGLDFHSGDLHLAELGLWLDAREPKLGSERVFISHAHGDHIAEHREVILSAPTAKLLQARLPGTRHEHVLSFGETQRFGIGEKSYELTLLPAGHIFGSAMALIQADGQSLLYTGDFKLRRGLSAEPCEPRHADYLIMETTYGRPQYMFPPTDAVLNGIIRFCREALDNDETAVLLGYSLGKSQELLCSLAEAGLPFMLHGTVFNLTKIYEQFGQCFPKYEKYQADSARGKVLLCPPNVVNSAVLRNLGKSRSAILTGWSVDPNCRYRHQCDAAFPLSDHADFPDLLELVKRVQPKKVYTLHGFAADFAQTLRELGYDAQALSQNDQLALALTTQAPTSTISSGTIKPAVSPSGPSNPVPPSNLQPAANSFLAFAATCARIAADARKLEKVQILAEYIRGLEGSSVALAATWFSGRPFPPAQNKVLQLGGAILSDALRAAGRIDKMALHQIYLKHSDSGETAAEVLQHREVQPSLSLERVNELFDRLYAARGPLAKTPLLKTALEQCTPLEAKYMVKIITGDLRIGLKEGLVEEGIASAFGRQADTVRQANLVLGDIGETAWLASGNRLHEAKLVPFRPIKFMLASPEATATAVWERVHANSASPSVLNSSLAKPMLQDKTREIPPPTEEQFNNRTATSAPVWLEDKYDGIRCQLHKVGRRVALYSRDLKEITTTFLDLADAARAVPADFILDGEIVAMRGEEVLPFAELQKRLGRKQADLFMREEVPIKFVAFDLLWTAGTAYLSRPLRERRQTLESLAPLPSFLVFAHTTEAASKEAIEVAFDAARARGNEGLMIKEPGSPYTPGRRGLAWLKLKKPLSTLDCVVVGAEYGHGKRSNVLSDYTFAVRDEQSGELKTIGKAYTGLTDVEIAQLTQHFLKTAIRRHGRYFEVPPDTVLEIAFDKIQLSTRHNSGLAMRFPRIVRIRTDKPVTEIDTVATARTLIARPPR